VSVARTRDMTLAEELWSDLDLQRVASLYYVQDETMEAIAIRAGVSRSTVSRQLKAARARGIVRISVITDASSGGLDAQLEEHFGVRAHVVPGRETASDAQRLVSVARVAGRLLSDWFDDDMTVGAARGATVSTVMEHLIPKPTRGSSAVQLNGAVHAGSAEVLYVSDLLGRACMPSRRGRCSFRFRRSSTTPRPRPLCGGSVRSRVWSSSNDRGTSRCSASGPGWMR
jgi:DNA-binding transcriptional regulator LsrR (DeoR family)